MGNNKSEAFKISLYGAAHATKCGNRNFIKIAIDLLNGINGIDEYSIVNACKLVTFDPWYRNPIEADNNAYDYTFPDIDTIENIQILVKRSISFFDIYGPVVKDGFTFEPEYKDKTELKKILRYSKGSFGGYTMTVGAGDGDFLTKDTLWDFKVSKYKPTKIDTLQLLMYWIMGQHSGQKIYKSITKIGIYNPRLNTVYLLDINKIPNDTIQTVEKDVIGYK